MVYQTLGVNGRGPPPPRLPLDRAMGQMTINPPSSNLVPSRSAPRPPAINTTTNYPDHGPLTPATPSPYTPTTPSSPLPPLPTQVSRPLQALTPPSAPSTPQLASSTATAPLTKQFQPQRAAPLTPSQRQERDVERRRKERAERENKDLPKPNVPKPVIPVASPIVKKPVREQRISGLSEGQIMDKLRGVVNSDDPNKSFTKIKKVGQGASGSVYVAKYTGMEARRTVSGRNFVPGMKVAIKQMDLANQPRKELIVNEILVMKESSHGNIVNFLDSYLVRGNELWVVMEFMEGGALTDVIDHNTLSEDQISCISLEVVPLSAVTNPDLSRSRIPALQKHYPQGH
jgi:serine/threonine-protein kinase CLA4